MGHPALGMTEDNQVMQTIFRSVGGVNDWNASSATPAQESSRIFAASTYMKAIIFGRLHIIVFPIDNSSITL